MGSNPTPSAIAAKLAANLEANSTVGLDFTSNLMIRTFYHIDITLFSSLSAM